MMKIKINELAKLSGVSVRTLHYYDEIGLLKPALIDTQNSYRLYDERSLERMQEILFYRELDFPLKTISEILSSPNYDKKQALSKQKHLLTLKKERLERLIIALENAQNGGNTMNLQEFDNTAYDDARKNYEAEVKKKWGDTSAFKEHSEKASHYSKDKWNEINSEMDKLIEKFAECKKSGAAPTDLTAQKLVKDWQKFITENYYHCTDEILAGLGEMYIADERFKINIDKKGDGTAKFISDAIKGHI